MNSLMHLGARGLWVQPPQHQYAPQRELSLAAQCEGFVAYETTYNAELGVVPYFGLMFYLQTFDQPFDITTIELDLRSEVTIEDYHVMVYAYMGNYEAVPGDPSVWTLVANTSIVPIFDTYDQVVSHLVPATAFTAFTAQPNSQVSFYVTMNGPYIDNVVDPLFHTGEVAYQGGMFNVITGSGLSGPNFPPEGIDTRSEPMFAGKIHYKVANTCAGSMENTTMGYKFMANQKLSDAVYAAIAAGIDDVISEALETDEMLKGFRSKFGLQKAGPATAVETFNDAGSCIAGWSICPVVFGSVVLTHNELLGDELLYPLYTLNQRINEAIMTNHMNEMKDTFVFYIGDQDVAADYSMVLRNVSQGQIMDESQMKFLTDAIRSHLNNGLTSEMKVLAVTVDEQSPINSTRRLDHVSSIRGGTSRQLGPDLLGNLAIKGRIYGSRKGYVQDDVFVEMLKSIMVKAPDKLLASFNQELIQPNDLNQGKSYRFFKPMIGMESQVRLYVPPGSEVPFTIPVSLISTEAPAVDGNGGVGQQNPDEEEGNAQNMFSSNALKKVNPIVIGVGVGVGILLLISSIVVIYFCFIKPDEQEKESGRDTCTEDDNSAPIEEESDNSTTRHPSRLPLGRSNSFDDSYSPAPVRRMPARSRSFDDAAFNDESTFRREPLPKPQQSQTAKDFDRHSPQRSCSFDGFQRQSPTDDRSVGHLRDAPIIRGVNRSKSMDTGVDDLVRNQTPRSTDYPQPTRPSEQVESKDKILNDGTRATPRRGLRRAKSLDANERENMSMPPPRQKPSSCSEVGVAQGPSVRKGLRRAKSLDVDFDRGIAQPQEHQHQHQPPQAFANDAGVVTKARRGLQRANSMDAGFDRDTNHAPPSNLNQDSQRRVPRRANSSVTDKRGRNGSIKGAPRDVSIQQVARQSNPGVRGIASQPLEAKK